MSLLEDKPDRNAGETQVMTPSTVAADLGFRFPGIAIRCTGHAVGGKIASPRIAYAVKVDWLWTTGGTESQALGLHETKAATNTTARRHLESQERVAHAAFDDADRQLAISRVFECHFCRDVVIVTDRDRFASSLSRLLDRGVHTVTLAELAEVDGCVRGTRTMRGARGHHS